MSDALGSHLPTVLAVALAVLGAGSFAMAATLQHRAVTTAVAAGATGTTGGLRLELRPVGALLRRPGWLAGLALAAAGAGLHAVALVLAPVSVVQPIGVLAVPFAVLLAARSSGVRPVSGVLGGVALSVAGVGGFVSLAAGSAVSAPVDATALLLAGAAIGAVVLAVTGIAALTSGSVRCIACATAGAIAFGLVSALLRALAQQLAAGAGALDVAGVLAGTVVLLVVGGWLVQQAFASGPPELVIGCLTVIDPLVAVGLGVLLLGEGAAIGVLTALGMAGCAVAAAIGVLALARYHPDATAPGRTLNTAAASVQPGRPDF
ncbi:hypothetical protein [Pseudonocardia asaccharolytica]|uniref:Integral membrane protein n=1 Tax=Pseudonocardia asaccharolytica DSM 44247 = NBRC 16224 TaxID=1123024 RepID=A0A511D942_9PSEU|nr:hypothetical protein [Pseudonocardia asaccharolytica]GEL19468.1 hypothetical protein PA7_33050 [Pseudonocardia asaccharolytica DSM 44247 = NBRC 16224]